MRACRALVPTVAVAALAAGCTGGDAPDVRVTADTAAPTREELTVEGFAASVLTEQQVTKEEAGTADPLATVTVPVGPSATELYDVEATVVALSASERGTDLTFSVRTADGSQGRRSEDYSWGVSARSDLRSVELRPDADTALKPYTVMSQPDIEQDALCACVGFPKIVTGDAQVLAALFPPLPPGATEVALAFPGAEPVTVPVTRG